MSTATTRIPLADAIAAAERFRALFSGSFARWEFAGSIRRKKPDIGDIEHVVISHDESDLFPGGQPVLHVRERAARLVREGVAAKQRYGASQTTRFGDRYIGLNFENRQHELFICTPDNWGCILAIRTGSADFSRELVTRLPRHGFRQSDGSLCKIVSRGSAVRDPGDTREHLERLDCPDEETFFRAAGLDVADYPPEKREVPA